jgi:hypothetical protein
VPPLDQQLEWLDEVVGNPERYCALWCAALASVGGSVSIPDNSNDPDALGIGRVCDRHMDERGRRIDALVGHLDWAGHRQVLRRQLTSAAAGQDREITQAVRDFLRTEGRIFITPKGALVEGGGLTKIYLEGSDELQADYAAASVAYHRVKARARGRRYIARAVRMLGKLHAGSGCIVLEASARQVVA